MAPGRSGQLTTAAMAAGGQKSDNSAVLLFQLRRPGCRPALLRQAQTQPHKRLRRWRHNHHFSGRRAKMGKISLGGL